MATAALPPMHSPDPRTWIQTSFDLEKLKLSQAPARSTLTATPKAFVLPQPLAMKIYAALQKLSDERQANIKAIQEAAFACWAWNFAHDGSLKPAPTMPDADELAKHRGLNWAEEDFWAEIPVFSTLAYESDDDEPTAPKEVEYQSFRLELPGQPVSLPSEMPSQVRYILIRAVLKLIQSRLRTARTTS